MLTKRTVIFILIIPQVFPEIENNNQNCVYSWQNYTGPIPDDAIPGGKDSNNETFYIGLVHLKLINEIFAGMIIPSLQIARITSLGLTKDVKNDAFTIINILCSHDGDAFEWIETKSEDLHLIPSVNLVRGGKVLGQDLYIGRVIYDGGIVLGKVFPHGFIYQGLYAPTHGTFTQFLTYEVLIFDCKRKQLKEEIDMRIKNSSE